VANIRQKFMHQQHVPVVPAIHFDARLDEMYACPVERSHADGYHSGATERRGSTMMLRWRDFEKDFTR